MHMFCLIATNVPGMFADFNNTHLQAYGTIATSVLLTLMFFVFGIVYVYIIPNKDPYHPVSTTKSP